MGIDRRRFLKIAGVSALMGVSGKAAFELLAPGTVDASMKNIPLTDANKWGMVVDMHKMTDDILKSCQDVCHRIHNVPDWVIPGLKLSGTGATHTNTHFLNTVMSILMSTF